MVELTIKEKQYQLASEWTDVTYGQYIDVLTTYENKWPDLDMTVKLIACLSDNPIELEESLFNDLDINDLNALAKDIKWINTDFIKIAEAIKPNKEITIDDKKYVIKGDYHSLKLGEMTFVEESLKNPNLHPQEIGLSVLLRPLDENGNEAKFNIDFANEVLTTLKYKINMVDAYNYCSFFLRSGKKSTKKITKGFSLRKLKK